MVGVTGTVAWYTHRSGEARRQPVREAPPRPDVELADDETGYVCARCGAVHTLPDGTGPPDTCREAVNGCGRDGPFAAIEDLPEDPDLVPVADGRPVAISHRGCPPADPARYGDEVLAVCLSCSRIVLEGDDVAAAPDDLPPADLVVPCRIYSDDRTVEELRDLARRRAPQRAVERWST